MNRLIALPLLASALVACGEERIIDRPPDPPLQDFFPQKRASSIDILFVIDNSESMEDEQKNLASNFGHFLRFIDPDVTRVGESGEVDYRLAITTTDVLQTAGALVGNPPILRPSEDYNPLEKFQDHVIVGIKGGSLEAGLDAALMAMDNATEIDGGEQFLRPEAWLYVIVVSDEDDSSQGELHYYYRTLETIKGTGNENAVAVSAITVPEDGACETGAEPGKRYIELARLTGGVVGDICAEDWAATLEELAVSGIGLAKRFQLDRPPLDKNADQIIDYLDLEVRVRYPCAEPEDSKYLSQAACGRVTRDCNGRKEDELRVTCEPWHNSKNGWVFNPVQNTVVFSGAAIPGPGSQVDVTYLPRTK